ncbi:GMC oxidoreductase [Sphingomonas oryzagri]
MSIACSPWKYISIFRDWVTSALHLLIDAVKDMCLTKYCTSQRRRAIISFIEKYLVLGAGMDFVRDALRAGNSTGITTSVIIVGAGPAGIALALALETHRVPCMLIEAGGDHFDKAGQDLYRAASIAPTDHGPVHRFRRRAFGGTTAIWGGRCIPFDPIDFEDRPWIPHAEWPIYYEEVSRYFRRALELCRADAPSFQASGALPDAPASMIGDIAHSDVILDRLELFSEPTHFGKAYRRRLRRSPSITVATHMQVVDIMTGADGRHVTGVAVRMPGGGIVRIGSQIVVVAAGALETARLLLSSKSVKSCGVGNEHDLVGRFYQSHLEGHVGEMQLAPGTEHRLGYERSAKGIYCRRYMWLSPEAQRREGLAGMVLRPTHAKVADPAHGDPVLSAMFLVKDLVLPEYARSMNSTEHAEARAIGRGGGVYAHHLRNVVLGSPHLCAFAIDWARRRTLARRKLPSVFLHRRDGRYPLDINAEQTPNSESRVALDPTHDATGMPRLAIRWQTTEQDRDMVARGFATIQRAVAAGTGTQIIADPEGIARQIAALTRIGGHHVGTARMGRSARSGVVDANCETFDVAGLYVAGAAAFPTSGFANPTLMIVALALRLGDRLADVVGGRASASTRRSGGEFSPVDRSISESVMPGG